jgi:hypothetical protein
MSLNKNQILLFLRKNSQLFSERFHVRRIGLFGSYVHDKQKPDSDIDILVEGENIGENELKAFLEQNLGGTVDVVKEHSLYNFMKYLIHQEIEYA